MIFFEQRQEILLEMQNKHEALKQESRWRKNSVRQGERDSINVCINNKPRLTSRLTLILDVIIRIVRIHFI